MQNECRSAGGWKLSRTEEKHNIELESGMLTFKFIVNMKNEKIKCEVRKEL